jgi:DNA-binding GntR family transcriptional regulator
MKAKTKKKTQTSKSSGNVANIYNRLREDIITKKLEPGSSITESALADRFSVSRSPVREALNRLHQEGLIIIEPNKGATIRKYSITEMIDLTEIRILVEPLIARKAAERADKNDLKILKKAADEHLKAKKGADENSIILAEDKFHRALYNATHSIAYAPERMYHLSMLSLIQKPRVITGNNIGSEEHLDLCECIKNKDGKKAEKIALAHIKRTLDDLYKLKEGLEAAADLGLQL